MGGKSKTAFSLHFKVKFVNMNKVNYQKVLEQIIEKNERENRVPTLLLHSCCAPCSSYCLEYLSNYFKITVFYYNPNIYPEEEYEKLVKEQQKFIEKLPVKYPIHFVEGAYEKERFYEMAKGLEDCLEGGERCFRCYGLRLREAAELAKKRAHQSQATKKSRQKMYEEAATGNPEAVERYENYLVTRRESYHRKKQEAERTA